MENEKGYHKLLVSSKARNLIKEIYLITEKYPRSEVLGLSSQTRRAAISVLLNIVEGHRRSSQKEFLHFLDIADGSLAELEACLEIASDLYYISHEELHQLEAIRSETAKMVVGLMKSVRKSLSSA